MNNKLFITALIILIVVFGVVIYQQHKLVRSVADLSERQSIKVGNFQSGLTNVNELSIGPAANGQLVFTNSSTVFASPVNRMGWVNTLGRDVYFPLSRVFLATRGQATSTKAFTAKSEAATKNGWRVYVATSTSATDNTVVPDYGAFNATTTATQSFLVAGWPIYDGAQATTTDGLALAGITGASTTLNGVALQAYGTTSLDGVQTGSLVNYAPVTSLLVRQNEALQVTIRQRYGNPLCENTVTPVLKGFWDQCEAATSSQVGFTLDVFLGYVSKDPTVGYTNQ